MRHFVFIGGSGDLTIWEQTSDGRTLLSIAHAASMYRRAFGTDHVIRSHKHDHARDFIQRFSAFHREDAREPVMNAPKLAPASTVSCCADGRAVEVGETRWIMKVIFDAETRRFLGAAIIGCHGDAAVQFLLPALYQGLTDHDIRAMTGIHPTVTPCRSASACRWRRSQPVASGCACRAGSRCQCRYRPR